MGRIKHKARLLRFELQQKSGENITIQGVANAIGVDRYRLSRIERGNIKEIKVEELQALCSFYSARLERVVNTNDILDFDINNQKALDLVGLAA